MNDPFDRDDIGFDTGDLDATEDTSEAQNDRPIVYVRKVDVADLPDALRAQVSGLEEVYAIGGENGEQLALVRDRNLAFTVARQNALRPVSVH